MELKRAEHAKGHRAEDNEKDITLAVEQLQKSRASLRERLRESMIFKRPWHLVQCAKSVLKRLH